MTNKQFRSLFYKLDTMFGSKAKFCLSVHHMTTCGKLGLYINVYNPTTALIHILKYNDLTKKWELI